MQDAGYNPASLSALAAAAIFGWLTPSLPLLMGPESEIPMTVEEASWLVSIPELGTLISPIPAGIWADQYGRKTVLLSCGPVFLIGWAIVLYFLTFSAVCVARLIQGLGVGIVTTVLPMYLGEIATPKYRGMIVSTYLVAWWFGYLLQYILGYLLSFTNFTYVTAITNVVFIAAFVWQPETPYYYLLKNDVENAKNSLSWFLFTSDETVSTELLKMKESLDEDRKNKLKWKDMVIEPVIRKSMLIMMLMGFIRMMSGLWPLASYSTQTLTEQGDHFVLTPHEVTIAMGVMMVVGGFGSSVTLDVFGRRALLLYSCMISGICMFSLGIFYTFKIHYQFDLSTFNWVPSVSLIIFSASSVLGVYPVCAAYQSELFDTNARATASSIWSLYLTVIGFIPLKLYLTVSNILYVYVNFYIFAFVCFFGAVLAVSVMPETKGKSFEQIMEMLKSK